LKNFNTTTMTIKTIKNVSCNCCAEYIEINNNGVFSDYITIEKKWGYLSPHDGETHNLDLCSTCYSELIKNFKISPIQIE
jgi:hypothetical protein